MFPQHSQYKGDKWDSFRKLLPEALLRHINGNAIYNLKDPLLDRIVQQLEGEVNTTGNGVPYDYRIAQIVLEGKEGVVADLPTYPGVADPVQQEVLDYVGFDDSSTSTMLKTTKLVGNYADTNMIAEYFPQDEVFVHGARMFHSWKTSPFTGSLTLVVSDFTGETPYKELLGQFNQIKTLPFHRLLLAVPYAADISVLEEVPIDLPVDVFDREPFKDSLSDYCDVLPSLKTEWFMLTDSHVRMMSKLSLMVTEDEGKPLVSFVDSDVAKCYQDDFCHEDLLASQMYVSGNDRVFRNDDTVFSVAAMKEYCATLGGGQERHRPSATGYFAFLESSRRENGGASTMYAFSDRAKRGSRLPFRKYLAPTELDHATPSASLEMRRFLQLTNTTECEDKVTELECEETVGCDWDNDFGSCKDMPTIVIIIIVVVSPVDLPSPTAPDQTILINALRNFVSTEFSTIAQASVTSVTFQNGDFTVNYELSVRLTDVLTAGNVESAILQALTANGASIAAGIAATATQEQGPSSSLDLVDSFVVQSVEIKDDKEETCDGTGGFMFFFCIIAKAFGSFAGFIKWIINFLTFGIFSK
jgi:hypothetical protein